MKRIKEGDEHERGVGGRTTWRRMTMIIEVENRMKMRL